MRQFTLVCALLTAGPVRAANVAHAADPLPVFDAHLHYSHDAWELVSPKAVVGLMRKAGVKRALVSRLNDDTQALYKEAPDLLHCPHHVGDVDRRALGAGHAVEGGVKGAMTEKPCAPTVLSGWVERKGAGHGFAGRCLMERNSSGPASIAGVRRATRSRRCPPPRTAA